MGKLRTLLILFAALFVAGCEASGSGTMDIHRSSYFDIGDVNPYGGRPEYVRTPAASTYSSELSVRADDDKHSAQVSIRFPGFTLSYIQGIDHYSCTQLQGDWQRCTGDEEADGVKHGPVRWIVDIEGHHVVRAWLWEMKPTDQAVYLGLETANRPPKLIAYFGDSEHRHQWPPREPTTIEIGRSDASRLTSALADLHGDSRSLPAESAYTGAPKIGETPVSRDEASESPQSARAI